MLLNAVTLDFRNLLVHMGFPIKSFLAALVNSLNALVGANETELYERRVQHPSPRTREVGNTGHYPEHSYGCLTRAGLA